MKAFPGVKTDKRGRVVIPLQNEKDEIRTLQRISGNGFKSLKKNGQKSGSYFVVGGELKMATRFYTLKAIQHRQLSVKPPGGLLL